MNTTMQSWCRVLLWTFSVLFLFSYPFAVIGVAFDVQPPFSLAWAGSFLLFLEGLVLIVAAMYLYGWRRALLAGAGVIVFSYLVETLGVRSGFPFGHYGYSGVLVPPLPGSVPLAVMFAWLLIVLGAYGIVFYKKSGRYARESRKHTALWHTLSIGSALLGALLATLLDLAIEPVAFHVVHYWQWMQAGALAYYGVPFVNFAAWFVTAFVFLLFVDSLLHTDGAQFLQFSKEPARSVTKESYDRSITRRLALLAPPALFLCSLFMFGLVDLTHGYYYGALSALLGAVCSLLLLRYIRQ